MSAAPRAGEQFVRIDYLDLEVSAPGPASVVRADGTVVKGAECEVTLRADIGLTGDSPLAVQSETDDEWIHRDDSRDGSLQVVRRIGRMPVRCRGKLADERCVRATCASLRPIRGGIAEQDFTGTTLIEMSSQSGWGQTGGTLRALGSGRVLYAGPNCPKARVFADRDPDRVRSLVSAARDAGFFTMPPQVGCHDCMSYRIGIFDGEDGRTLSFARRPGQAADVEAIEASFYDLLGPNPCANFERPVAKPSP